MKHAARMQQPAGIWPVLYAFFDQHNRLDRRAMEVQVESLIRAGAPGIVILGLATEVNRLSVAEKREVIAWAATDIARRVPLAVTLNGDTAYEQLALADYARTHGADAFILQPPSSRNLPESFYAAFFAEIMAGIDRPCGIQNAPEYLGVGLSPERIAELAAQCTNFTWLKCEGSASVVRKTIDALRAHQIDMPVFNGRGGQELVENLDAGCAGMIVAPDTYDKQLRIFRHYAEGDRSSAEIAYAELLPAIEFVMRSLDDLTCYGKRIAAWRMGFDVDHDRGVHPSPEGLGTAQQFRRALGPYPDWL